jgi:hypothetical protein
MFGKWVKSAVLAAAVGFVANAAQARTVDLVDNNGVSSGWSATMPDAGDDLSTTISFVRSANGVFYFNKTATFTGNSDPVIIEFNKTSATASTLAIGTESITNSSGADWTGFRTLISNASTGGTGTGPSFAFDAASGLNGFTIDPFTTFTFSNNNTELDVSGGTVASGAKWTPGNPASGGLTILAANSSANRFLLKEIPLAGGTGPGPGPAIPLPAAAWTGMTTLLGLAVAGSAKRARKA